MSRISYKWLPVIDTDVCSGCGECQRACPTKSIDLVWDFATLGRPEECTSCNLCMKACAFDVIQMDWVSTRGEQKVGRWCEERPVLAPAPQVSWFRGLVLKLDRTLGLDTGEHAGCGVLGPEVDGAVPD